MTDNPEAALTSLLARRMRNGGDWFFWIAGFSIINTLVYVFGAQMHFVVGLGTTQLFDSIGKDLGSVGRVVAFVLDLLMIGSYALFGVFTRKGRAWAFIVGMILYALDAVLLLLFQDFLAAAFHAYALWRIWQGFQTCRLWTTRMAEQARLAPVPVPDAVPGVWPPPPTV